MNAQDKKKIQYLGDYILKQWKRNINPADEWENLEIQQAYHDLLNCMIHTRLINDFNLTTGEVTVKNVKNGKNGN